MAYQKQFYRGLVDKFCKIMKKSDFPDQFKKIIKRHKIMGYNITAMQPTARLVFNPVMVDSNASLFHCTTWGHVSDSMTVPT